MQIVYGTIFTVGMSIFFARGSTSYLSRSFINQESLTESTLRKTGADMGASTETVPEASRKLPSSEFETLVFVHRWCRAVVGCYDNEMTA